MAPGTWCFATPRATVRPVACFRHSTFFAERNGAVERFEVRLASVPRASGAPGIVLVEQHPGGGDSGILQASAAFGEHGRLAEAAGGVQHGEAAVCRHGALHERAAIEIAGHPAGHRDLLGQEPGRPPLLMGASPCLPGRSSLVAFEHARTVSVSHPCTDLPGDSILLGQSLRTQENVQLQGTQENLQIPTH